jgi:hypothetical protein
MNVNHQTCPACGSLKVKEIIHVLDFPAILFPIESEKRASVNSAPLLAAGCDECDHIFLNKINLDFNRKLYSNYYYLYPYSDLESMVDAYRNPFERIFKFAIDGQVIPEEKTLLEIGCSSDKQLDFFRGNGFLCTGISPGAGDNESESLIDGFYEGIPLQKQFSCIVSRFNLEHVIDLGVFLEKVRLELKEGGLFFVQVPNIQCFLSDGMLGVFAHEHPHYFSRSSLLACLERAGFKVELIQADVSSPSIIAVARKRDEAVLSTKMVHRNLSNADAIINHMQNTDSYFVFYGAGMSLCNLLYIDGRISEFENRIAVVDDNQFLIGKYMPNTNIKITTLSSIVNTQDVEIIVLLNKIYHSRVMPRIVGLGFRKIHYLKGGGMGEWS